MSTVMIKCPTTGTSIPTGIETEPLSFLQLPDMISRARCPHCGLDHAWWKREAWLEDRPEEGHR